jgi:hypothetical protein
MAVIDLEDLGHYARHVFDHPRDFEGRDLEIASEHITWEQLVKTFTKVGKGGRRRPLEAGPPSPMALVGPPIPESPSVMLTDPMGGIGQ